MASKRMQTPNSALPNRGALDGKVSKQMEPPAFCDNTPVKKAKGPAQQNLDTSHGVESLMADAHTNLTMLISDFTEVLRERASADYMQMQELDDILTEARDFEAHLQEKKEHLRQSLAVISQKLQA